MSGRPGHTSKLSTFPGTETVKNCSFGVGRDLRRACRTLLDIIAMRSSCSADCCENLSAIVDEVTEEEKDENDTVEDAGVSLYPGQSGTAHHFNCGNQSQQETGLRTPMWKRSVPRWYHRGARGAGVIADQYRDKLAGRYSLAVRDLRSSHKIRDVAVTRTSRTLRVAHRV